MKMNKKKLAVLSLIVCIVSVVSLGSLAWFTATDTLENKLKFVTSFEMDLYETDENGKTVVDTNDATITIGRTYEDIVPGMVLHKDPTVINKSSGGKQYIRITVTVDHYDTWSQLVAAGSDLTAIFTGFESSKWTRSDEPTVDNTKKTITYVFYLNEKLEATKTATLFTGIKIPESLTIAQAKAIGECTITIKADAIQSEGLGDNVTTAKQAFAIAEGSN